MAIIIQNRRELQPRNAGSDGIARSAIDATLPRAIRQYERALSVNGFPVLYWRRKNHGLRCTCTGGVGSAGTPPSEETLNSGVVALDPRGAGTRAYLDSMLQGSVFSIDRYGSRPKMYDANGVDNVVRSVPHSPLVNSREIHNKTDDLDDPFAEQIEPSDTSDLFSNGIEHNLAQATATQGCGVCLGTGWTGGYDPSNAWRGVYDTQAAWRGDVVEDTTTTPRSWSVRGKATLDIVLPAGAVGLEVFRVWNNREPVVPSSSLVDGVLATSQSLLARATGRGCTVSLQFDDQAQFTHLELQFEMGVAPVYAEWSRLAYNENLSVPENLDNPSITLSPSLPHVALYDLIGEPVYRKLWKINSCNPAFDRERQINGWEVTARLLQTYELPWLLPRRQTRVYYGGNRVPVQPRDAPHEGLFNPYNAHHTTTTR